jgi:hypothetical protein
MLVPSDTWEKLSRDLHASLRNALNLTVRLSIVVR